MSDKKILKFDLAPMQVKIKDLLNKQFLDVSIDAISDAYPNRNNSHFTKESLEDAIPSVKNKPVLGAFGKGKENGKDDFDEHNADLEYDKELGQMYWDYENGERILGTVRESDYVGIENKNGNNWLVFRCCLWTQYNYKAVKSLLKSKRKRVSVEIEVLDSYIDDKGIEVITKFSLLGVTILGDKTLEGIPGANLTILEKLENALFKKEVECLQFAYKSLDDNQQENNLDNSNFSNSDNFAEKGGDEMLTVEQKKLLLESKLKEHFEEIDDNEEKCCYYYICDMNDSEVFVRFDGEYIKYPYNISEEEEVSINFEMSQKVLPSWKDFVEESSLENEKENENFVNNSNEAENNPESLENNSNSEEEFNAEVNDNNNENVENHEENFATNENENQILSVDTIEIDGESYDIHQLYDKYIALQENYSVINNELVELKEKIFKEECDKMYDNACKMIDDEDDIDPDEDKDDIEDMKCQVKEKCDNKEFKTNEECESFVENMIAKFIYRKRKEMKKNNSENIKENNFSVNILKPNNQEKSKNPIDVLNDYIEK